jgi:hypothetical protein
MEASRSLDPILVWVTRIDDLRIDVVNQTKVAWVETALTTQWSELIVPRCSVSI